MGLDLGFCLAFGFEFSVFLVSIISN